MLQNGFIPNCDENGKVRTKLSNFSVLYSYIVRRRRSLIYCILSSKAVYIYKLWRCHYQMSSYYNIQVPVHADPMRHEVVLVRRRALWERNCWVENFEGNAKSWHVQRWERKTYTILREDAKMLGIAEFRLCFHRCTNNCAHGLVMDEYGCPAARCKCREICDRIK